MGLTYEPFSEPLQITAKLDFKTIVLGRVSLSGVEGSGLRDSSLRLRV